MNYYPEQLEAIVNILKGLNEISKSNEGNSYMLQNHIKLVDSDGFVLGTFGDEIGGSWSFFPAESYLPGDE